MSEEVSIAKDELEKLRERAKRLALEKSYLQLVYDLIAKLGGTPGLANTAENIARLTCATIGGSNVTIYYAIDDAFRWSDALGMTRTMDAIDDEMAREVMETGRLVEQACDFRDTGMLTPQFTSASTWAAPLMVGEEIIAVLKIDDTMMSTRHAREQFHAFFDYAALVLKNELRNYAQLRQAYDQLGEANARLTAEIGQRKQAEKELRKAKKQLETRVSERTAELQQANAQLLVELAERERVEAELRKLTRTLQTLSGSNHLLMRATEETGLLRDVCRVAVETAGYRMAWVGFVEHDEEKTLRPAAWAGAGADYLEHIKVSWGTGPTGQGPAGRCIRERRPVAAQDIRNDPSFAPWRAEAARRGYQSVISLPLLDSHDEVFGALLIYAEEPNAFDAEEKVLLSELAGDVAFGIEALRERQRRAEAEKRVREAARYARSLIEANLNPLVTISPAGKITDVNKATEQATGIPRDRLIGTDFADYFTEPDKARAGYQRVLEEGLVRDHPLVLCNISGALMDVEYNATVYRDEAGRLQGVFVAARDVTESKKARAQMDRLAAIVTSSDDVIFSKDLDGTITSWNAAAEALYGYSAEEAIGRSVAILMPPGREGEAQELIERVRHGDPVSGFETQRRRKDGSLVDMALTMSPIRDSGGDIVAISVIGHDITERKRAEQIMQARLRLTQFAITHSLDELLQATLDEAEALTGSAIGFYHFLDADQQTLTLQAWSTNTLEKMCTAEGKGSHYPIAEAGVWVDCVRERRPVIHNDYASLPHRRGTPEGHAPVVRELVTPVLRGDKIVAILGVGNKLADYDLSDVRATEMLADLAWDTAERKRAEEALRESEQRCRDIIDYSVDLLFLLEVTEDGHFRNLEVNPAFERSTGMSRDQLIGKTIEETVPEATAEAAIAKYRHCVDAGVPIDEEAELELPTGRRFYFSTLIPLRDDTGRIDRILGITRDITERREMEEVLRASQRKLTLHLEQTLLGVIEWDAEFRAREWNPAAEAIFGYSRQEALGRHAAELILPEAIRPEIESVWERLLQQKGGEFFTNENVTKDGRTILCEWLNTPLVDDSGTVVGVMSLARDITERKRAEELRIAKEAAEAASVAKSTFLANMSHEIRTPMNAILGFSQLLRRDPALSPHQRKQLDIINSSGGNLLALINDVLEMSRIESGRISVNPTAFDLYSLLGDVGALFALQADAKGLELRVTRTDEVPRFVVTDENKLRQVFVNLLSNAVKFTEEGSVSLRLTARRDGDGKLRLLAEVEDTGPGIAAEDVDALFQDFEQAGAGREARTGSGLGLAISRAFVRLLGGEITVRSQVGKGSIFSFDVVVEEAAEKAVAGGDEGHRVTGLRPGEPRYRVLIADDAEDNRELLVQLLGPVGFNVRAVSDGEAALREFGSWQPHLIMMDMRMPRMDGYEAIRRIRAAPGGASVAIIGVTASAFAEMRQGVFDAGADDFLAKPFRESKLFDKIGRVLGVGFVREDETAGVTPETVDVLDTEALAALPSDLIDRLRQATIAADFDAVLELVAEVAQRDERLAAALRTVAERFDGERLLAALPEGEDS